MGLQGEPRSVAPATFRSFQLRRAVVLLALFSSFSLYAQGPSATVVGSVQDATGAALPGASLKIVNINTSETRQAVSSETGEFTVPGLAPGEYEIVVEKQGFHTLRQSGITLQVDQTARFNFKLEVGSVSESVEVHAEAPLINTENATKGEVIATEEMVEMPLDGRDFADLANMVPGVMPKAQGGQGSNFNINGARADNTNFIVDGFNDQNPRAAAIQVQPNLDAMQEFKMQTSGYSAEYGRLAGGVMNMVLKSGTNKLHATIFEFLRNDKLDSRNFFDVEKHELRRNQFGATVSGPVVIPHVYNGRDRTFFLFSWESYRQVLGENQLSLVPTALEQAGDFSQSRISGKPVTLKDPFGGVFPGNKIPVDRISPISRKIAAFYPLPNRPGEINNYQAVVADPDYWDGFVYKVDQRIGSSDNLSVRLMQRYNRNTNPFSGSDIPLFGHNVNQHQNLGGITFTHMFTPTMINELRLGVARTADRERGFTQGTDYAAQFGIPGTASDPALIGFPRFTINNLATLGNAANQPVQFTVNNYQWGDTFTWVHGRHLVKLGGDITRTQLFQPYYNNNRGTFNFLGRWSSVPYADFLMGFPETTSRQLGMNQNYLFTTFYGFFAQDDFKLSSRLTLNLGLRYDILKPPLEKYGRESNFVPELGKVIVADDSTVPNLPDLLNLTGMNGRLGVASDYGLPKSLVNTRYRNLSPRIGLAWRPTGDSRMVVRGGYGIFYGGTMQNDIRQDLADIFPFVLSQTFNRVTKDPNGLTLADPFPASGNGKYAGVTNTSGFDVNAPSSYLQSWNLTVEREIGWKSAIEIAYAGSKGTHLGRKFDINQPYFDPALKLPNNTYPRPYAGVNTVNYYWFGGNSIFNAGTITLRRRFAGGMFYRANYTYSKSIDNASQLAGTSDGGYAGAQNARDMRAERGRSDWDMGHSFSMNLSWESPFHSTLLRGWQIAGTGRAHTGQPFTPRVNNVNLNLGEANRPDRIAKGMLPSPNVDGWFDLAAFPAIPTGTYRFGNSGRNILDGPGFVSINSSLMRNFRVGESARLQARWEVFNVMNHPNLALPNVFVNANNGAAITAAGNGRTVQFALRLMF